jgi:hypothetical protein
MITKQLTHIADVKVGKVKGKSRIYPQLRLPNHYADLAGKKASVYEVKGNDEEIAFLIRFDTKDSVAAYNERAERFEGLKEPAEPCRGYQLLT